MKNGNDLVSTVCTVFLQVENFSQWVSFQRQFSQVAGFNIVDQSVQFNLTLGMVFDIGWVFLDGVDGVHHIQLHKTLALVVYVFDFFQFVQMLGSDVSDRAQPVVQNSSCFFVGQGGPDTTTVGVATDNDLLDLQDFYSKLQSTH